MDGQDWTPVIIKRKFTKKEAIQKGMTVTQVRDSERSEKQRLAKLDNQDIPTVKKRINSESLQNLIRKRIELKLTQDKADAECALPKHTFKGIESGQLAPNPQILSKMSRALGVNLKLG